MKCKPFSFKPLVKIIYKLGRLGFEKLYYTNNEKSREKSLNFLKNLLSQIK